MNKLTPKEIYENLPLKDSILKDSVTTVVNILKKLYDNISMEDFNAIKDTSMSEDVRLMMCRSYMNKVAHMWPLLTKDFIDELAEHPMIKNKKCLEVFGGAGWLSGALAYKGVDVICTDKDSVSENRIVNNDVIEIDALEAISKYNADILIISWPPYTDIAAYNVAKKFTDKNPGGIIFYIGELQGGCCAEDNFFDLLMIDDSVKPINNFISYYCINDRAVFMKKNT